MSSPQKPPESDLPIPSLPTLPASPKRRPPPQPRGPSAASRSPSI
ncbi:hypothetical protein LINPERPRIM_LOCUS3523 [Linum perenne]